MDKEKSRILTSHQIQQKLTRMAHEIYENNYKEKEIVLIGIAGQGNVVAERLAQICSSISDVTVTLGNIKINKEKPLSEGVASSLDMKHLHNKSVILVDDVLNSGKTMIYAVKHLLNSDLKNLATAVLVERFHRKFPVRADFVGLTLSTNMKEHVSVEIEGKGAGVYLL